MAVAEYGILAAPPCLEHFLSSMAQELQIVMVEDSPVEAELVKRQLKNAGWHYHVTRVDTEAALRLALADNPPNLILSDFSLPQFSGMSALQVAVEVAPDIPFIFVSGTIGEERAIEALRRGATDYVLKTNLVRLVPVIERALRESAARVKQRLTELLLQDIVATSQDWIWQLNAAGHFIFCSPAIKTILGYEPSELLDRHYSTLDAAQHGNDPLLPDPVNGPLELSGALAQWRHRDGRIRWLERNATVVFGAQGELAGFRGTDRDVTDRHEQELRIQRLSRVHRMLSSINSAIVRIADRDELLSETCRIAGQGGYDFSLVSLVDPGSSAMRLAASAGFDAETLTELTLQLARRGGKEPGMTTQAIQSGSAVICNDLRTDPRVMRFRTRLEALGVRAVIVLPLLVDGTGIGAYMLCSREANIFDDSEVTALREMVANIGFALQYFEKETTVRFLSYFDPSTGLAKRSLFCERLSRQFQADGARDSTTAIVVFDVQRLGLINDTYGRHVTDRLLEEIADRMKREIGNSERAAHFGGGTFAAAYPVRDAAHNTGSWSHGAAAEIFGEPFIVDGHEIRPAIRAGVAYFPLDGQIADTVVQGAEVALSHAKASDERQVVYGLLERVRGGDRVRFEARLGGALERSEFVLHYQPKVNALSGHVEGVEALLRWEDPDSGLISPARFIPLLENTGMIVEVGQWVLEQAARDCMKWLQAGLPALRVAVNISPAQMKRRDFVSRTADAIGTWTTAAAGLDIEITESSLMQNIEASTQMLQVLREAGMRIAIDDFGSGYSSLLRLANLPIDTLKIDQSFIQAITGGPQSLAIVKTIVALARSCAMSTVAEGVETSEQLRLLQSTGCDQIQGYLFSRPVPAEMLPDVLQRLNSPTALNTIYTPSVESVLGANQQSRS